MISNAHCPCCYLFREVKRRAANISRKQRGSNSKELTIDGLLTEFDGSWPTMTALKKHELPRHTQGLPASMSQVQLELGARNCQNIEHLNQSHTATWWYSQAVKYPPDSPFQSLLTNWDFPIFPPGFQLCDFGFSGASALCSIDLYCNLPNGFTVWEACLTRFNKSDFRKRSWRTSKTWILMCNAAREKNEDQQIAEIASQNWVKSRSSFICPIRSTSSPPAQCQC